MMRDPDVLAIVTLTRDRDAWQALALQTIAVLRDIQANGADDNWIGQHDAQLHEYERRLLTRAVNRCDGNMFKAAQLVGLNYKTFQYRYTERAKRGTKKMLRHRSSAMSVAGV